MVCNKPKTAAYRAPGAPAAAFAFETVIDEVCDELGMDPLDFRLLNGAKEGTRRVAGPRFPRIGYLETVQAAKEHQHYSAPLDGPNRGRGVASGFWFNGTGPSSATASVNSDGTVSLVEGSPDIGGSRAAVAMQLAEVLGISAEDVRPVVGDTDSVGYTSMTGGSSVAFKTGWACYEAAQDVSRQMIARAARIWDVSADDVVFSDGSISHRSDPEFAVHLQGAGGDVEFDRRPNLWAVAMWTPEEWEEPSRCTWLTWRSTQRPARLRSFVTPHFRTPGRPSTPATLRGRCREVWYRVSAGP